MYVTWRLPLVLVLVLIVAVVWSAPPTVHVEGRVMLTSCPGTEVLKRPPGSHDVVDPVVECSTAPVGGATFIFAPPHGDVSAGVTNGKGQFRVDLAPGTYIVAARGMQPVWFASQPEWVVIPAKATFRLDIGATFAAA